MFEIIFMLEYFNFPLFYQMKNDLVSIRNVFQKHIYVYSLTFNGVQSFDTTLKRRHFIFFHA